ncbi:MAG: acyltransferase, partial [Alphaproteobacteria bacterium]
MRSYPGLQSIRGLAAVTVLLHHASYFYQLSPVTRLSLDAVLNAHAAVILFFVLSGYVLANSAMRTGSSAAFYVKRVFRIMPGLWVATALCVAYMLALDHPAPGAVPRWRLDMIGVPRWTPQLLVLSMLGFPYVLRPAYTIVVEIAGSILIPVLTFLFRTMPLSGPLCILALTVLSYWFYEVSNSLKYLLFMVHFAFGVQAAELLRLHPELKVGRWIAPTCLAGLVFSRLLVMMVYTGSPQELDYEYDFPTSGLLEGLFATGIIIAVIANGETGAVLRHPALVWLGDRSYGIYLLHLPALFFCSKLIDAREIDDIWLRLVLH